MFKKIPFSFNHYLVWKGKQLLQNHRNLYASESYIHAMLDMLSIAIPSELDCQGTDIQRYPAQLVLRVSEG